MLSGLLTEYNVKQYVASDIGIDEMFVTPTDIQTQETLNNIADWLDLNKMQPHKDKTYYMVFSRSETKFATRLTLEGNTLDCEEETKLVSIWLTTWLDLDKKAYTRLTMLTKLRYVGVPKEDLIQIYILCAAYWNNALLHGTQLSL